MSCACAATAGLQVICGVPLCDACVQLVCAQPGVVLPGTDMAPPCALANVPRETWALLASHAPDPRIQQAAQAFLAKMSLLVSSNNASNFFSVYSYITFSN